jgi:hypothetical protein
MCRYRVLAIAVFSVATMLTPSFEGQMRTMQRTGSAAGVTAGSNFRSARPAPGSMGVVSPRAFGQHVLPFGPVQFRHNLRSHFFVGNTCFGDPFFCRSFFFRRRFLSAQPLFLPYPAYTAQSYQDAGQAPEGATDQDYDLAEEVGRLAGEVEQLRDEQRVSGERAQRAPRPSDEDKTGTTVLVFRDGRRDEVQNYAIVGGTLWVFTPQQARKIRVADLDVKATKETNGDRGVEFQLPR